MTAPFYTNIWPPLTPREGQRGFFFLKAELEHMAIFHKNDIFAKNDSKPDVDGEMSGDDTISQES